jgi:hypothetical protein
MPLGFTPPTNMELVKPLARGRPAIESPARAGSSLLVFARNRLGVWGGGFVAFGSNPTSGTTAAASATPLWTAVLLLAVARAGMGTVGRKQVFRIVGLLVARGLGRILVGPRVATLGTLRFDRGMVLLIWLLIRMLVLIVRVAGILLRPHLAVAVAVGVLLVLR